MPSQLKKWSELYEHPITECECADIARNISGFFSVLTEWDNQKKTRLNDERNSDQRNSDNTH